jgi:hypothetical protein
MHARNAVAMESAAAMFPGNARVLGAAPVLEVVAGARRMRHGDVRDFGLEGRTRGTEDEFLGAVQRQYGN